MSVSVEIEDLGRAGYAPVLEAMRNLAGRVARGESPGKILLVEHDPVYTAGRATPEAERVTGDIPVERGGKITYHGPGQLVVYPVLRLPKRDVHDWLRRLERFGVAVCAAFGLDAVPSVDSTGVFVGDRKVASIGVAIRRWVNLHGIAINVAVDPDAWQSVRPCGMDPEVMADLNGLADRPVTMDDARRAVRERVFLLWADANQV